MLTIKNLSKRTQVFNLPHEVACSETSCGCSRAKVGVTDLDPKTGEKKVRAVNKRIPASVTLQPKGHAGDEVGGLVDGASRVPEIVNAIRLGTLTTKITAEPTAEDREAEHKAALEADAANAAKLVADEKAAAEKAAADEKAEAEAIAKADAEAKKASGGGEGSGGSPSPQPSQDHDVARSRRGGKADQNPAASTATKE